MTGDYHLGRSCRRREENNDDVELPGACGEPPETMYVKLFAATALQGKIWANQAKSSTQQVVSQTQERIVQSVENVCLEMPKSCNHQRTLKERIFCGNEACEEASPEDFKVDASTWYWR